MALAVVRLGLVYAMDHIGRGLDDAMTRWRVGERVPWVLAWALMTGWVGAWMLRAPHSATRTMRVLVVAAAVGAVLAGWPFDDAFHIPGPGSMRGSVTLALIAVAALGIALGIAFVSARAAHTERRARVVSLATALVVCLAAGLAARHANADPGETMTVRVVERDLTGDVGAWTVERARDSAPPRSGSLTASLDVRSDGGEQPALVMPPPCRVVHVVQPDEVGLRLRAAAGCDTAVPSAFATRAAVPTIVFRISIGDRVVLEHRRTPWSGEETAAAVWARLGDGDGVAVHPGDRVTLETDFEGGEPDAAALQATTEVGFGGLALERHDERPRTRATQDAPNIVLVVMDTLRADRTSLHGYARPTTPVLDALAARGMTFENACATSSWTWPSTTSILTGLEPAAHGVISDERCYLADEIETLPEVLQRAGYTTGAFACNPLIAPSRNFASGFEKFEYTAEHFLTSEQVMPSILGWLDAHASVRFFLYLHLVDPHELHRSRATDRARFAGPKPEDLSEHALHEYSERLLAGEGRAADGSWDPRLVVSPEHLRWLSDAYDAAVATGDHALGCVLDRIDALSLRDDTIVLFTSDHGEELLEHGLLQHGQALHTELVHVPLVLAGPGVASGVRVAEPVSNRHVAATLARIGGARIGGIADVDLRHAIAPAPLFLATDSGWWNGSTDVSVRALREDGWSLHCCLDVDGPARLYDIARDPGELTDLAPVHPDRAAAMRARIVAHERELTTLRPRAVRAGSGTRELLRATGYAGDDR